MEILNQLLSYFAQWSLATEIWVAVITCATGLAGIWYKFKLSTSLTPANNPELDAYKKKLDMEASAEFRSRVVNPSASIKTLNAAYLSCNELRETTLVSSVLILVAVNGANNPLVTSCVFDCRKQGEIFEYFEETIDPHYRNMVNNVFAAGYQHVSTEDVPGTLLSSLYSMENVKNSLMISLGTITAIRTGQKAYCFSSFRSDHKGPYDNETIKKIHNTNATLRLLMREAGYN